MLSLNGSCIQWLCTESSPGYDVKCKRPGPGQLCTHHWCPLAFPSIMSKHFTMGAIERSVGGGLRLPCKLYILSYVLFLFYFQIIIYTITYILIFSFFSRDWISL